MAIKILVVDDEILFQKVINQVFKQQIKNNKYEFHFATNGKQALEKVISGLKIDIMLVDIRMPEMDGLTLIEELNNKDFSSIRTIIISAYADIPNFRKAMNERAFDFLVKPIEIDELERCINKLFNLKEQSASSTKYSKTSQATSIKAILSDPLTPKVSPSIAYKIFKQLQPSQQVKTIRRVIEDFSLEELNDLKYELEAYEYIEIERQEELDNLATEVYDRLGFDEAKIPRIALEKGYVEERVVKRNLASGETKDYGIHLYLIWSTGTSKKTYYLGPASTLDERTKTFLSLLGYSISKGQTAPVSPPEEDTIKPLSDESMGQKPKPKLPIKLYGKKFDKF